MRLFRPARSAGLPAAVASAVLLLLPAAAVAQDKGKGADKPARPAGLSDRDIDRLADALVDRLADRLADELAERLDLDAGPDADIRGRIADLVEQAEPEGRRDAIKRFFDGQWPAGEPVEEYAVELAGALGFLGQRLSRKNSLDAFALAAELAERAIAADAVPEGGEEALGQVFYNAACAHARVGETDAALADLDRAFEYGFSDVALLKEDSDLNGLRDLPAFTDRLQDWEKAAREALVAEAKAALAGGESFPLEFTYTDIDGEERSLDDYRGKVVIVDFWGTWCPPCRREIPSFITLQKKYGADGLQILGLNYGDEKEEIAEYAAENKMNYPTGLGSEETQEMVPDFGGFPTTVFVGRDGTVRAKVVGLHEYGFLEAVVTQLLAEEAPAAEETPEDAAGATEDGAEDD